MSDQLSDLHEAHPAVRRYILQCTRSIASTKRREECARELLAHALEIEDELHSTGMSADDIARETIRRLGDALTLEKQMKIANESPLARWFLWLSLAVGSIVIMGAVIYTAYLQIQFAHRVNKFRQDSEAQFQIFAQDETALESNTFTAGDATGKNAAPVLNPLFFMPGPKRCGPVWSRDKSHELTAADISSGLIIGEGKMNWQQFTSMDLSRYDFSWMKQLSHYSYWDPGIIASNPLQFPCIMEVWRTAKARLSQGIQTNHVKASLKDVYQLARLLYFTNVQLGAMVANVILREETVDYRHAVKVGLIRASDWKPLPDKVIQQMRRSSYNMFAFLYEFGTPTKILKAILDHPKWRVGLCPGLAESMRTTRLFHGSYKFWWPGEIDARKNLPVLMKLYQDNETRCHLATARKRAEAIASGLSIPWAKSSFQDLYWQLPALYLNIPYLRQSTLAFLMPSGMLLR